MAEILPGQDIHALLETSGIPEELWFDQDDLCDCTFQRIGWWTNPYIARTLEARLCCMWARLYKMFPDLVREIPAFDNYNAPTKTYEIIPQEWNGEGDMPRALWHRQVAIQTGLTLEQVRHLLKDEEPPKGKPKPRLYIARS